YTLPGNVTQITPPLTTFPTPPSSGPGSYDGPGQLLGDLPARSDPIPVAGTASILGSRQFDGDIFSWRLGPYMEVPFSRRVSTSFSGGLAVVGVLSQFGYNETVRVGNNSETHDGFSSHGGFLVGGYVSGTLSVMLAEKVGLFGGVQFQDVGTYS